MMKEALHSKIESIREKLSSNFSARAGLVLIGSAAGQAIAFVLLPAMARIYPVDSIGRAATTLAVLGVFGLLATLQYDQAVIVASDQDLPYLLILAASIALGWTTVLGISLLLVNLFWSSGVILLDNFGVNGYLLLLVPSYALFLLLINFRLRSNQLGRVSTGRLVYYGGGATLQVIGGLTFGGIESVFLLSQGIAAIAASVFLFPYQQAFKWLGRNARSLSHVVSGIRYSAKAYGNFPKYQAGAQFLNAFSAQAPVIIMRVAFSDVWAAYFFMASRLLATPTALLAQAVGQVFYRDSAERERLGMYQARILERVVVGLVEISLIPAIALGILSPLLVDVFLGEEWAPVARIIQILLLMYVAIFFTSPISTLLNVKNLQRSALGFNALLFGARIGVLLVAWLIASPWGAVWGYATASLFVYLPFFVYVVHSVGASVGSIIVRLQPLILEAVIIIIIAVLLGAIGLLNTWFGASIIVSVCLMVLWREYKRAKMIAVVTNESGTGTLL